MKKNAYHVTVASLLLSAFTSHAMEEQQAQLDHLKLAGFQLIMLNNQPLQNAISCVKNLAEENPEWKNILDDAHTTGQLIQEAYILNKAASPDTNQVDIAVSFGTKGACEWCKEYLTSDEWSKRRLSNQLLAAAERNDQTKITTLVKMGIDVNVRDQGALDDGGCARLGGFRPALICAVKQMNFELARFLLVEHNANPNITTTKNNRTPLIIAVKCLHLAEQNKKYENFYNSFAIMRLLLQHPRLDVKHKDRARKNVSHYAKEYKMDWLEALLCFAGNSGCVVS